MSIEFTCLGCGKQLSVPGTAAGKRAKCRVCGNINSVPAAAVVQPLQSQPPQARTPQAQPPQAQPPQADDDLNLFDEGGLLSAPPPPLPDEPPGTPAQVATYYAPPPTPVASAGYAQAVPPSLAAARRRQPSSSGPMMRDFFKALGFGLSNMGNIVILLLVTGLVSIGVGFIFAIFSAFLMTTNPGRLIMFILSLTFQLTLGGYITRFYLDIAQASAEGCKSPPPLPQWDFNECVRTAVRYLGVCVIYVLPLVTIPLLPLGILALAYTNDVRAFDLTWAIRAAVKRPGALLLLWIIIVAWAVVVGILIVVMWVGIAMWAGAGGKAGPPSMAAGIVLAVLGTFMTCALFIVSGVIAMRCIGLLGHHNTVLLEMLPREPQMVVAGGYLGGGFLGAFLVYLALGSAIANAADKYTDRLDDYADRVKSGKSAKSPTYEYTADNRGNVTVYQPPSYPTRPTPEPTPPPVVHDFNGYTISEFQKEVIIEKGGEHRIKLPAGTSQDQCHAVITGHIQMCQLAKALDAYRTAKPRKFPTSLDDLAAGSEMPQVANYRSAGVGQKPLLFFALERDQYRHVVVADKGPYAGDIIMTLATKGEISADASSTTAMYLRETQDSVESAAATRDTVATAEKQMSVLYDALEEYASAHDGVYPQTIAELKVAIPEKADLIKGSYTITPNVTSKWPDTTLLAVDQQSYTENRRGRNTLTVNRAGKLLWFSQWDDLRSLVSKQVEEATKAGLIASDSPIRRPTPRPTPKPKPAASRPADGVTIEWDWGMRWDDSEAPESNALSGMCEQIKEIKNGNDKAIVGLHLGPAAKGKNDDAYAQYKKAVSKQFYDAMAKQATTVNGKPTETVKAQGIEFERLLAQKDSKFLGNIMIGIQDGRCVSYWLVGPGSCYPDFLKGVGKAKLVKNRVVQD